MGDDSDEVFVTSAAAGTVAEVEKVCKHWKLHRGQHTPPPDQSPWEAVGMATIHRDEVPCRFRQRRAYKPRQSWLADYDTQ